MCGISLEGEKSLNISQNSPLVCVEQEGKGFLFSFPNLNLEVFLWQHCNLLKTQVFPS